MIDSITQGTESSLGLERRRHGHPCSARRSGLARRVKDLAYALAEARARGVEQPITEAAYRLFARGGERGLGPEDVSSVVEVLRSARR